MDQITIRVKDRKKAKILVSFLKTLDYIEKITSINLPVTKMDLENIDAKFFALAGIWANRDITIDSIRQNA
jgi:hypothetical protein